MQHFYGKYIVIFMLGIALGISGGQVNASKIKTTVYLYTYHKKPPFIVDLNKQTGLFYDLSALLSQRSTDYRFVTVFMPRKRLDRMIELKQLDGVVIGANPVWFRDVSETRFFWLPAIFSDADEFVSLKITPFEYTGDESLYNKTLAGVAGYYYFRVNKLVQSEQLNRIDTIGEHEVLSLIAMGRADVGIVSRSVFRYMHKHGQLADIFHFSAQQHEAFERRAFVSKDNPELYHTLEDLFQQIHQDGSWERLVYQYQ